MRVPVPDRPGVIAEVTTLASELSVNIFDLEIAHSAEGERGVLLLVIDADKSASLGDALTARGLSPRRPVRCREHVRGLERSRLCAGGCASQATSRSRTGRCCWRRGPAARRASQGLSDGDDVRRTAAAVQAHGRRDRRRRDHRRRACTSRQCHRRRQLGHDYPPARRLLRRVSRGSPSSPVTHRSRAVRWTAWPIRYAQMGAHIDGRGDGGAHAAGRSAAAACTASTTRRRWPVHRSSRRCSWPGSVPRARPWCASRSAPGPTPRRCSPWPAPTSRSRTTATPIRVRSSELQPFELARAGRSVAGRILGRRRADRSRQRARHRGRLRRAGPRRLHRRAAAYGRRHRHRVDRRADVAHLHVRTSALHGTAIDGDEIPSLDEVPALAVAAARGRRRDRVRATPRNCR